MEDEKLLAITDSKKDMTSKNTSWWRTASIRGNLGKLTLLLAGPIFFLNAKAFHDGYLNQLGLSPSMFPIQPSDLVGVAAIAWFSVISDTLIKVGKIPTSGWLFVAGAVVVLGLVLKFTYFSSKKIVPPPSSLTMMEKSNFLGLWGKATFLIFAVIYIGFVLLVLVGVMILLFIHPFSEAGRNHASSELKDGFKTEPVVKLVEPGTKDSIKLKIIECSTQFCALYSKGKIFTVPTSSITWAVSRPKPIG